MFGRADRCLTDGQRALGRRDFADAERRLRAALAAAPGRAHIRLYLAHALAEQERRAEADRELAAAMAARPGAFVFPLHAGIIALDAGDLDAARAAVTDAARLAPDNRLVAGYATLVAWLERGGPPAATLARAAGELPSSFGARALVAAVELVLATRGARAAMALLEAPPEPMGLPLSLRLGALRHRDRIAYAERLVEQSRFEEAACVVTADPALVADPRGAALLDHARRGAIRTVDEALAASGSTGRGTLLLHRYDLENDLGDVDAVARTLTAWRDGWVAEGTPARQRPLAAAVLRRLAAAEVERGRHDAALALCAESRQARPERETAGVEALARLALGQRRAARHAFEEFLHNSLFPLDSCLASIAESSA